MCKIQKLFCLATLVCIAFAMAACNTTEGFGKDIESGGKAIKETAQDAND